MRNAGLLHYACSQAVLLFQKFVATCATLTAIGKAQMAFLTTGGRGALVLLATVDILTWLWYYVVVEICACKIALQPDWLQSTCSVAFFAYVVASLHHNCAMQQLQTALFACAVCYHAYTFFCKHRQNNGFFRGRYYEQKNYIFGGIASCGNGLLPCGLPTNNQNSQFHCGWQRVLVFPNWAKTCFACRPTPCRAHLPRLVLGRRHVFQATQSTNFGRGVGAIASVCKVFQGPMQTRQLGTHCRQRQKLRLRHLWRNCPHPASCAKR